MRACMLRRLAWLLAAIPVAMTLAHLALTGQTLLHSDGALKSVIAALAIDQGRLVPHGWTYANGDLLLNTPYLILLPIQWIGGLGLTTNLLATAVSYLLLVASAAWLAIRMERSSGKPSLSAPIATAIVASSIGAGMLEFTVTQGAYSFFIANVLLLVGLAFFPGARALYPLVVALAFCATVSNPVRGIVQVVAPLALALMFHGAWQQRRWTAMVDPWRMVGALLSGATLGILVYQLMLLPGVANYDAAARVTTPSIASISSTLASLAEGGFRFMALSDWAALSPLGRVAQYLGWLVFLGGLLAPGYALLARSTREEVRALAWVAYGTLAAGLLPLVLTQGLYQGFQEWRYASIGLTLGWVVLAFLSQGINFRAGRQASTAILFLAAIATSAHWPFLAVPGNVDAQGISNEARASLVFELKSRGIGVVGTSYWNSHVLTVLSNGGVTGLPIAYNQRVAPFPHHMPHVVRQGDFGPRHALALTLAEWRSTGEEGADWQFGPPAEAFTSGPFLVKVYGRPVLNDALDSTIRFDGPADPAGVSIAFEPGETLACLPSCILTLRVTNTGMAALSSNGHYPFRIGLIGMDEQGRVVDHSGVRLEFPDTLMPGETQVIRRRIQGLNPEYRYKPCLLQENVSWLCGVSLNPLAALSTATDRRVDPGDVLASLHVKGLEACSDGAPGCEVVVSVRNDGRIPFSGAGTFPLKIGVQVVDGDQTILVNDAGRLKFSSDLMPAALVDLRIELDDLAPPATYRFCLLQEGQQWLCDRTTE